MEDKKGPRWVVDPHGHIVKQPGREPWKASLKDGWRDATEADMRKAAAVEKARAEAEKAEAEARLAELRKQHDEAPAQHGGPLTGE